MTCLEEEHELQHEADRIAATDMVQYNTTKVIQRGEEVMAQKRKRKMRLLPTFKKKDSSGAPPSSPTAEEEEEGAMVAVDEDGGGKWGVYCMLSADCGGLNCFCAVVGGTGGRNSEGSMQGAPPIDPDLDPVVAEEDRMLGCTWDGKVWLIECP